LERWVVSDEAIDFSAPDHQRALPVKASNCGGCAWTW